MKKLFAFLLVAAMLVSLTACGGKDDESILGVYSEDARTYENGFIGIGCKLDAEWDVFDTEEIAALNSLAADMMTDEKLAEQLQNSGLIQPFFAQLEAEALNVNITLENLGVLYGSRLSEQEYAEKAIEQLPTALQAIGLTDITTEIGTITFAGKEHVAIFVTGSLQGVAFYETMVCMKVGRYIASVTAGSYLSDTTADVLAMFYSL